MSCGDCTARIARISELEKKIQAAELLASVVRAFMIAPTPKSKFGDTETIILPPDEVTRRTAARRALANYDPRL